MPIEPLYRPTRPGVVLPVRVDPLGRRGPTRKQARGPRWRRTSHGFYVPVEVDDSLPEQRITESVVVVPAVGGLTGWAALRWHGASWFDGTTHGGRSRRPVTISTCYRDVRDQLGIRICQERLAPDEVVRYDGVPTTRPVRSVWFETRYSGSLVEAVVAFDVTAFADLVSLEEYVVHTLLRPGWTGAPRAREVIGLAHENSWSPQETRLRMLWVLEAGLETPLCNTPLFDRAGRHLGTPDLFDPEAGLVVEYDGRLHLRGHQRAADLRRVERFESHGLTCALFLAEDLLDHDRARRRLLAARRRARTRRGGAAWTLDKPSWWRPTETVEQRRALARAGLDHLLPRNRLRAA